MWTEGTSAHGKTTSSVMTGILFIVAVHVKVSQSFFPFVVHFRSSLLALAICCSAWQVVAGLGGESNRVEKVVAVY